MTANPLIDSRRAPTFDLDAYVAWLNSLGWVQHSGRRYFVAQRRSPDGQVERFLDHMAGTHG